MVSPYITSFYFNLNFDTQAIPFLFPTSPPIPFGKSYCFTAKSLSLTTTDRWLNNDQAAADSANFMANVKFPGVDEDLTAPGKPWIYYGVRSLPL